MQASKPESASRSPRWDLNSATNGSSDQNIDIASGGHYVDALVRTSCIFSSSHFHLLRIRFLCFFFFLPPLIGFVSEPCYLSPVSPIVRAGLSSLFLRSLIPPASSFGVFLGVLICLYTVDQSPWYSLYTSAGHFSCTFLTGKYHITVFFLVARNKL